MKTALTIAGSDSSGGAGIQADIKTMTANGVFAMSAITALTAQNTTGVTAIFDTTPQFLAQQLDAVFTDIYPDAVKIGMVSSAPLIDTIAERLHFYGAKHIVVDPVMVATSGAKLLQDDAVQVVQGQAHCKPQHPRHRLHPVQRHRFQSGQGVRPRHRRGACQGLHFRLSVCHAGFRARLRPHGSHLQSEGRFCP